MDITFVRQSEKFNFRVGAVMIADGRLLAMKDERSPYFYLPGGRVRLGETAEHAVIREMQEELGIAPVIVRPLWLNQAFFTEDVEQLRFHEICLYFLLDVTRTDLFERGDQFVRMEGGHTHTFAWLPFERLAEAYFYPLFLKREIFRLPEHLTLRTELE